jgi:hypothetical protein
LTQLAEVQIAEALSTPSPSRSSGPFNRSLIG